VSGYLLHPAAVALRKSFDRELGGASPSPVMRAYRPRLDHARRMIEARQRAGERLTRERYNLPAMPGAPCIVIDGKIGEGGVTVASVRQALAPYGGRPPALSLIVDHCIGGNFAEGKAIHDFLRSLNCPVDARVISVCASAATLPLMAATYRECGPRARFCIHGCELAPSDGERWTAERHRGAMDFLLDANADFLLFLSMRTGTPIPRLKALAKGEQIIDATTARSIGLVHSIIGSNATRFFR
jgi:ATP-dependent protease ClpP protease subunit